MKVFRKITPGVNPDIQVHTVYLSPAPDAKAFNELGNDEIAAMFGGDE